MIPKLPITPPQAANVPQAAPERGLAATVQVLEASAARRWARFASTLIFFLGVLFANLNTVMPELTRQLIIIYPGYALYAPRVSALLSIAGLGWLMIQRGADTKESKTKTVDNSADTLAVVLPAVLPAILPPGGNGSAAASTPGTSE